MKISLLIALLSFAGCSSGMSKSVQNEFSGSKMKISFQGRLNSLPSVLKGKPLRVESRFYRCTETDFGKLDADRGIYPRKKDDCRDRFISSSFSFPSEQTYKFEQEISSGWTHGFIRLLDIEEVSGKYSPGDNPFWFSPDDLSAGNSISHDFSFISMKNPIPGKKQEELAAAFAPVIVMKKGKKFYPSNLEKYHKKYRVEKHFGKKPDSGFYEVPDPAMDQYLVLDESLYGTGDTHLYYHVRPADVSVSGASPKALPGWRDNRNYRYQAGASGETVISYYFWYDYNEGPTSFGNSHEGDLESFAVLLDRSGKPKRVMATGHNHVMIDTVWENINSFRNHPVLYIAHGNKGADGGNPTSFYGGHTVSLDAGNSLFTFLTSPKDIFPEIGNESELILPADLKKEDLVRLRIGPGEWIDKNTKYLDASPYVSRYVKKLVQWPEPGWIGEDSSGQNADESLSEIFRFRGRLGRHPRSSLNIFELKQYGKSPVNVPFKMNDEQHFTLEKPQTDRCENGLSGDYCPKFRGDRRTPQF
ncbi:MAG TPA: hypothetical protein PL048_10485 [Leptospiraceae bacterium]|nr:hypothetical protein [Leptospiraceae bacterium]HNH06956.1 hypothetical protein [Leptospiraceae bacterium]